MSRFYFFLFIFKLLIFSFFIKQDLSFVLSSESEETIYDKLKKNYFQYVPKNFIADIESKALKKDLDKIPKDAYCSSEKNLNLKYISIQYEDELLIIENVENPFVNRFQMYIDLYKTDKMILEKSTSFQDLIQKMIWKLYSINQKYYIIKIQKHLDKKYYSLIYIEKESFFIKKINYYESNKFLSSISIEYKKKGIYFLPEYLKINLPKGKILDIKLKNYRINFEKSIDLIKLQDDCINIDHEFFDEGKESEDILNMDKKAS